MKEHYFFKDMLHGKRQIHVALRNFGVRLARSAKQLFHFVAKSAAPDHGSVGQNLHSLLLLPSGLK